MKIFVSGGCKNGKSTYAEAIALSLAKSTAPCYYVATMQPMDGEDNKRIAHHQASREGLGFETIEWHSDIDKLSDYYKDGVFLLDSTTALLANEMFIFTGIYEMLPNAPNKVASEITKLLNAVNDVVIVSDYIYGDAIIYPEDTEAYRKGLSLVDRTCAGICDVVIEVCYGNLLVYKGEELMEGIYEAIS